MCPLSDFNTTEDSTSAEPSDETSTLHERTANPYREYDTPTGKVSFSKEEFASLVEHLRVLAQWRKENQGTQFQLSNGCTIYGSKERS